MNHAYPSTQWRVAGASVRGASHMRSGLPNQDALCCLPIAGGPPLVAPADVRLFGNETTSLCLPDAWNDMHVDVQPESAPALILLASDGYANSFSDDAAFRRVGSDLLEMIRADGLDAVSQALPGWLADA